MCGMNPWSRTVPVDYRRALRRLGLAPSRHVLTVSVLEQTMRWWERLGRPLPGHRMDPSWTARWRSYLRPVIPSRGSLVLRGCFLISTSKFGVSQQEHSNGTPLGLHRVARKIGGGRVMGTVFQGRRPVGNKWQGMPEGRIMHRILWLEGMESGFNRGGDVDTYRRYVYIHGCGDESTLGKPDSHGCIHVGMSELLPLYDRVGEGTQVWIDNR